MSDDALAERRSTNPDESCDESDDWDLVILLSFKDPISRKTFYNFTVHTYDTLCYNIRGYVLYNLKHYVCTLQFKTAQECILY